MDQLCEECKRLGIDENAQGIHSMILQRCYTVSKDEDG